MPHVTVFGHESTRGILLWDIAGQASGLPVHKLLGGKIRDRVRVYGNSINNVDMRARTPQDYAELSAKVKEAKKATHW